MTTLYYLVAATVAAVGMLLAYGHHLFEENATRVPRTRRSRRDATVPTATLPDVQWHTLVGSDH